MAPPPSDAPASGRRVLIVEDDESIRNLFERVFSAAGYTVHTVSDGVEALRQLEGEAPDLVVLDLMLPWVNGIEVLVTVRKQPQFTSVPVIVATGAATSAYDLREFGPVLVLHKPFPLAELLPAARKLLCRT
jgi:DNA-binding response OmpR family regulator